MDLVSRLLNSRKHDFSKILFSFKPQNREWITSTLNFVGDTGIDRDERKQDYQEKFKKLLKQPSILPFFYYSEKELDNIRKNSFETISYYGSKKRKSGEPAAIHSVDITSILLSQNTMINKIPFYVLISGLRHDNIEDFVEEQKKSGMVKEEQCDRLLETLLMEAYTERIKPHSQGKILPREMAYIMTMIHKVTRFESDRNYYKSIDRIFSRDITRNTNGLVDFFKSYESEYGPLEFDTKEIDMLIEWSACIKVADRISNTLNRYSEQTFSDRIKGIYKNMYLLNKIDEYISDAEKRDKKHSSSHPYRVLTNLRDSLAYVNEEALLVEEERIKDTNKGDKNFFHHLELLDDIRADYIKEKGYSYVDKDDFKPGDNINKGMVRRIWDKMLNEDKKIKEQVDNDPLEQYVAVTGLLEINTLFRDDKYFTLEGFRDMGK